MYCVSVSNLLYSEGIRIVKIRKVASESLGFGIRGGKEKFMLLLNDFIKQHYVECYIILRPEVKARRLARSRLEISKTFCLFPLSCACL